MSEHGRSTLCVPQTLRRLHPESLHQSQKLQSAGGKNREGRKETVHSVVGSAPCDPRDRPQRRRRGIQGSEAVGGLALRIPKSTRFRLPRLLPVPRWDHRCTSTDLSGLESTPQFGPSIPGSESTERTRWEGHGSQQFGQKLADGQPGTRVALAEHAAQSLVEGRGETRNDSEHGPKLPRSGKSMPGFSCCPRPPACVGGEGREQMKLLSCGPLSIQDRHSHAR